MKNIFIISVVLMGTFILGCKKTGGGAASTISLMQHQWMIVSVNGEALRYLGKAGDYFNFATDGFLYEHMSNIYDTAAYTLLADNSSLLLYPIINGVKSTVASNYKIKLLSNNQFIIGGTISNITALDSLKR